MNWMIFLENPTNDTKQAHCWTKSTIHGYSTRKYTCWERKRSTKRPFRNSSTKVSLNWLRNIALQRMIIFWLIYFTFTLKLIKNKLKPLRRIMIQLTKACMRILGRGYLLF